MTEIKTLIHDPYSIYARRVLRLYPLNPLQRAPDALLRGIIIHRVLEEFVKDSVSDPAQLSVSALLAKGAEIVGNPEEVPFPTIRHLWQARLGRIADWFTETERARQAIARPARYEVRGHADLPALGFRLKGQADRIDIDDRGLAHLYDYKTGAAPTADQQRHFDKQLLLEAAMVENGAFPDLAPRHTERAVFVSVATNPKEVPAPLDEMPAKQVWAEFEQLITRWFEPERGFTARAALLRDSDFSNYDHLSRFGEWDVIDAAEREILE